MASCGSNTGEGFNPEQFETPPSQELMCGICLMVVNEPFLTYCGLSYCNFCFNKWRNGKDVVTCPLDYKQLETNVSGLMQFIADKKTERLVLSLCVKYMNGPCSWKGELRDKKKHLTKCDHEVIKCVFDGCDTRLARNWMEKHEETCEWKIVTCEFCDVPYPKREEEQFMADKKTERQVLSLCVKCMNGPCSWKGELRDKKKHLTKCDHEVIKCVFDGCDTRLARNSMEKHEETCEWKIVTCEFCDVPYPKREEEGLQITKTSFVTLVIHPFPSLARTCLKAKKAMPLKI
ncbi:predicted protein [Nematostella vectensis]|uniref:Uncharacterized protein n=1 Tax=Nematostella vectensis TaxID=45351 RepID=A7T190_NEMVE|nr:predicted protein [Nematostella vectensis]|eukprot:XP_001622377.1 predicted protein [Nematostella vectensis]